MKKYFICLLFIFCIGISITSSKVVYADDSAIQNRIESLYNLIGGKYFNVGQNTGCGAKSSGHSCDNCLTSNIVNATWFKNLFGTLSTNQFANQYGNSVTYTRNGWSCLGFSNFAEWYIFKTSDTDTVSTTNIGTYDFNYSNVAAYAKIGDILRLNNSHSVIFISASSSGIYVLDSNWDGDYNCYVKKHDISYSSYSTFTISRATNRESVAPSPVDIGTDFYGLILNTNYWKPITCDDDGYIRLRTEEGYANQVWKFERQNDGSYVISSAANGKALEMYNGNTAEKNPVAAASKDWGGNYQRWYIYAEGSAYVLKSKHYTGLNRVLTLANNQSAEGTAIVTATRTNDTSQIWSVYKGEGVQLKAQTLSVTAGTSATNTKFSWTNAYGETVYNLRIIDTSTNQEVNSKWNLTSTSVNITLPAGKYRAYVDTCNYFEYKPSNEVTFTVEEATHYVLSTVKKSGTAQIVETKLYNFVTTCDIAVVGYKDGELVTVKSELCSKNNATFTLEGDIDEIKVMAWQDMDKLIPLCDAEVIPSDEWIIE